MEQAVVEQLTLSEQRIQDISSLVSDYETTRDLVETTNMKLVDPFFEALFTLDHSELWLIEQGIISLIRLMQTHIVEESTPVITESSVFYDHLIQYIPQLYANITMPMKEDKTELLTQRYILQMWAEAVSLMVHSHQYAIIKELFNTGVLVVVAKMLVKEEYKFSTILMKSVTVIINELIDMQLSEFAAPIIKDAELMPFLAKVVSSDRPNEFTSFASEIVLRMSQNAEKCKEYGDLLASQEVITSQVIERVKAYDEELKTPLMLPSETTAEISDDEEDYDYNYDDEEEEDEDDEEDDLAAQMEDFFDDIKNNPSMLEEMEVDSSAIPDMRDDPLMPRDLPVFSKKFEHLYDEINHQDSLFV